MLLDPGLRNNVGVDENEISVNAGERSRRSFRITVELPLFLLMMGISLSGIVVNNIVLYRSCVHALHFNKEDCKDFLLPDRSNSTQGIENEVQKYATRVMMVLMVVEAIVPGILSLFIGVWSDTHGRKPLLVWPLFGMTVSTMFTVVYSVCDSLGPWWMIVLALPYSFCGGISMLNTGAYCYISDVTTEENRSLRMTIYQAILAIGSVIGSVSSSYLLKAVGNINLILITASLYVSAYILALLCIKESLPGTIKGGLSSVLNFGLLKEMVAGCFKPRPNNVRAQILLLALANTLLVFVTYGLYNLEYLYTRQKLHWVIDDYSLYSGVNTMISFIGGLLGVAFLQKLLGMSDAVMMIGALVSAVVDCVVKSLAVSSWQMYFGSSISLVKGLCNPLIMSSISKVMPVGDTAKAFALLSVLSALCPILAPIVYNTLYSSTISSFPGAFYMLTAGINMLCVFLLGLVQYYRWSSNAYQLPQRR